MRVFMHASNACVHVSIQAACVPVCMYVCMHATEQVCTHGYPAYTSHHILLRYTHHALHEYFIILNCVIAAFACQIGSPYANGEHLFVSCYAAYLSSHLQTCKGMTKSMLSSKEELLVAAAIGTRPADRDRVKAPIFTDEEEVKALR